MKNKKITYSQVGDNYETKDPIKKNTQSAAKATSVNLKKHGFKEIADSRGESAYVWKQGKVLMASVVEGLGTKNLIADGMRKIADSERSHAKGGRSRRTYYDVIGHDTIATIINDLVTVGAKPLVVHAYWAIEDNDWLYDKERMNDLINGWKTACDIAGASWGGGETATMKQIVVPGTCELAGSAIGIISSGKRLIMDKNMKSGDRILLIKSNGVNANGISLTRAIAKKLPNGYATKMPSGKMYGEGLLTKSNIYAKLIQDLLDAKIDIHYISNITGHGMRKIMRARKNFTYVIEKIFGPQEVFLFIQKHAGLNEEEMYGIYNMGMDYAIFMPEKYMKKAQSIVKKNKFESIDAGYIEEGKRQVIIKPKNITFKSETLDLR
ncbi:MAG: phosphoribosylformylglycinamidine cyclo-ligase [Candidatus Roizmanbacteria bacterium]|nr:MAG: phosphoribosylformylglycinamidine cyclo-ligase [Candidatus Roizmanbacteria bacterium]